jgi:hypothetical protein
VSLTLADVDGLLYTALSGLLINVTTGTTEARPFATVGRYAGSLDETSVRDVIAQYPAALLAYEGETVTRTVNTLAGDAEDRGLNAWTVYVCVEDARAIDDGTVGSATAPGGLRLVDAVLGVLNGLLIVTTGAQPQTAWMDRRLRCVGTREALIRRGVVYVYAVGFEAARALPQVTPADDSVELAEVRGDVNLVDTLSDDDPQNPVVQFIADTTEE